MTSSASGSSPMGKLGGGEGGEMQVSFESHAPHSPGAQPPSPKHQARRKGHQPHSCLQPVGALCPR